MIRKQRTHRHHVRIYTQAGVDGSSNEEREETKTGDQKEKAEVVADGSSNAEAAETQKERAPSPGWTLEDVTDDDEEEEEDDDEAHIHARADTHARACAATKVCVRM